ncbi:MAG: type III-B CRISPR-associated protein Cas10/Cmr2 [Clostridium cochlearium]|uniref:type III-B CRISPR-associated protein Cas10/Cmr2 n=1 Tax=Clostridium cochlearium TaxID=1494 RepID=UPI00280B3400|nr:type III-B CRISPR-associated protein Cas10/Cmr2 [Clostridium cochlearium]MDU1443024.1 type III-B CRISPR-associated protein Cas10/Cmr2 [Clostridium cochlearium]
MSYLLGITIGPVQSYIEDSRKLRDLYGSSKIISDISKEIYEYVKSISKNCEIIYPYHDRIKNVDFSNYMIIKIEDFINLKDVEDKIFNKFNCKIEDIKKDFNINFYDDYVSNIKDDFYLFWVMEEIEDEKDYGYSKAYEKLTKLILDIKNTYEFDKLEQSGGKKCSICGKRNIITNKLENRMRRKYMLNSDEDLCLLCLFKRYYLRYEECYLEDKNMKSIYEVAIRNWKFKNEDKLIKLTNKLKDLFNEEDKYYNPNEIDNVIKVLELKNQIENNKNKMIFKNLERKVNKIKSDLKDDIDLKSILEKFKDIKDIMNEIYYDKSMELPNYEYAFVQFDIDNLGCWMSGEYLEDKKNLMKYQQKISNTLIKFSQKLSEELTDKCNVIYSGGDDFLSILPKDNIIEVVNKIEELFKNNVENELKEYITYDRKITYSISITIAPCKDPMSYVLNKTKSELENVKNIYKYKQEEKNGVAINYIINNGKSITAYLKQGDLINYIKLIKSFEEIKPDISFAYINNFENEFINFDYNNISFNELKYFIKIAKYELKRMILRCKVKNNEIKDENAEEYINDFVEFISEIISSNSDEIKSNHINIDFDNITNIMKIYSKLCKTNFKSKEGE